MSFCTKCGKQLEDGAKFCPSCGAATDGSNQNRNTDFNITEEFKNFNNTADTTFEYSDSEISNGKGLSLVAYLGILVLIPIFLANGNKFIRFHANQGLVLLLAEIVVNVLNCIPFIGRIFGLVGGILCFVFMILGIVNAVKGRAKELPLIGKIRIIK